jgi:hypothetical protein
MMINRTLKRHEVASDFVHCNCFVGRTIMWPQLGSIAAFFIVAYSGALLRTITYEIYETHPHTLSLGSTNHANSSGLLHEASLSLANNLISHMTVGS